MKKAFIALAAMAVTVAFNVAAKDIKTEGDEQTRQQFFEAKVEKMTKKLQLSDEQKTQFLPLYKEYNQAMREVMPAMREKQEPTDDVNTEATRIKQRLENQKKAIDVQIKYVDRFAKILNAKQLHQFLSIERNIHDQIDKRRNGEGRGKGRPGFGQGRRHQRGHDRGHAPQPNEINE